MSGITQATSWSGGSNGAPPDFRDPFQSSSTGSGGSSKKRIMFRPDTIKVSPKTVLPPPPPHRHHHHHGIPPHGQGQHTHNGSTSSAGAVPSGSVDQKSPSWSPPDSWEVEKVGGDVVDENGGESSSDESLDHAGVGGGGTGGKKGHAHHNKKAGVTSLSTGTATSSSGSTLNRILPSASFSGSLGSSHNALSASSSTNTHKKASRARRRQPGKSYMIRIYRSETEYRVAQIDLHVEVAALTEMLNDKLLLGQERESHRLYLRERERVRILAQTEKPANIVRRRLLQAGYEPSDGLETMGAAGISFLCKFEYKSQLLGGSQEEELSFLAHNDYQYADLTGRSLRAIPIALHQHADRIITLKLSKNPMLEIPLDFIQSCITLRELKLSHMAMKRVPQSIRHSKTLNRLDVSSNRILELDDAYLDEIPKLTHLYLQNNRMEKLPWYFPRIKHLTDLNISNNKFQFFPDVLTKIATLRDLDISFNMISELPEAIGDLHALERLIIVGNRVSKLPEQCRHLEHLRKLDVRRNLIGDLGVVSTLPNLRELNADHNMVHALELVIGHSLVGLDASNNDITKIGIVPAPGGGGGPGGAPCSLVSLDISHAKLSSLENLVFDQLISLKTLRFDHNSIRSVPENLGCLTLLEHLSCSDNKLDSLPMSLGNLQKLEVLDAHNNCLTELPESLWNCASLMRINVTSNLLGNWHDPPKMHQQVAVDLVGGGVGGGAAAGSPPSMMSMSMMGASSVTLNAPSIHSLPERKVSISSVAGGPSRGFLPPLVYSLEKLYLGENRLTEDALHPLMILKELKVLNLSFNDIQEMPSGFFRGLTNLEELYLSGNKLASIPTEDLPKMGRLSVMFLNGNRLQTLPHELGKVKNLKVLDVGSNQLKYNINNWEFDWNWNFNKNLKYLNLSGNKRLQIKSDSAKPSGPRHSLNLSRQTQSLAGFTDLTQLRVLGLMDVTVTTTGINTAVDIPDEHEDRRVRTSSSTVNGMAYGIADALGRNDSLNMLDLVHEFRGREGEAIFAMFGRASPPKSLPAGFSQNRLAKYLHDRFVEAFSKQLGQLKYEQGEGVPDALRRTFLKLNQELHDWLYTTSRKMSQVSGTHGIAADVGSLRTGASGLVLYFVGRRMYAANVGNVLAVVSRQGTAHPVSRKHDPFDREETTRIRQAEGWVSPAGLVNEEVDVSRSFGFYHLVPVVNARPDIVTWDLSELDEFVIVANRGLWDYVPYQTAVDIARRDRADPMIAAQKLRDFAISYGADGSTMIMVIGVADLFTARSRQPTLDDPQVYMGAARNKRGVLINDTTLDRLAGEVPPPMGHLALVFTDIRNSTHLWECNPGMPTAMKTHNTLLRRQLRLCGGYEVKTEGDAFMCSFPTALAAVWFCLTVQKQLLHEAWPLEILECEDGKAIHDTKGNLIARGLSVRMGIHCGTPLCEPDPITQRMDYFGPMVNRSSRINGNAAGGQIMCSAEIIREINATVLETEPATPYSTFQPPQAIDNIRSIGVIVINVGEVKLKGLELPEMLSAIYPTSLDGRHGLEEAPADTGSRVPFSAAQMRELGVLCLRLEALASSRIFRPLPERKGSTVSAAGEELLEESSEPSAFYFGDPNVLLPPMNDKTPDPDLMMLLDSLSVRIENALSTLSQKGSVLEKLEAVEGLDERTLKAIVDALRVSP
ncbi:PP2C-domain-containing protein [Pluteus cervinus]|uniref:PP2C-domain-containing protein n=1 Tax=Pluteus cervinus TaxID=181527 RepID=A0ACD3B808_9AGAR|nr:PP2C-domain-containing protein [Pluteus cervinus]